MDPFIGEIVMFAGNFAPRAWAFCEGQLLPINSNQALFSILGTTYGGDGRTTFGLPDLRGRAPIHPGTGPGLGTYRLGQRVGTENVSLTAQQMPQHTHTGTVNVGDDNGDSNKAKGNVFGQNVGTLVNVYSDNPAYTEGNKMHAGVLSVDNSGGNQEHTNIPPRLGINYIICLQGVFPSRS